MSFAPGCGAEPGDATTGTGSTGASAGTDDPTAGAPTTGEPTTGGSAPACAPPAPPALQVGPGDAASGDAIVGPGGTCRWEVQLSAAGVVEFTAASELRVDDRPEDEPGWQRPRELAAGVHVVTVHNPGPGPLPVTLAVRGHGPPPPPALRERSLVWTQPELVASPQACGLACVMAAIADDGHGGRLLRQWFDRFATTAHSERLGPKQLLDEFAAQQGTPPEAWDLDAAPFQVTAIHSRLDLATDARCGELRISIASTHPIYRPFHLIFLFAQLPVPEDSSPAGDLHCTATALRWARLGALSDADFLTAAAGLLAERVDAAAFVAAESVEFTISPWEWRQWFFVASGDPQLPWILDNRPLFQTVDTPRLNAPGPERDAFLAWVEANAAALDQRRLLIPEEFRPLSARVNQGVPWIPLQLTPALDAAYPDLRRNLEIVGCPACHATDADFVQTLPNHTFSPFYDKELDARALHLDDLARGDAAAPPFGPLQPSPLLPP